MTAPVSAHAHLGVPSPEWTEFSSKHPERLVQLVGTPEHMRSMMAAMKSKTATLVPAITEGIADVRDAQVPVSDGSTITVRIYTPDDGKTSRPGLVYIHGGGWTLGDLEGEDITCRRICASSKIVVVSVDYRLAPEYPFPTGLDDSWDALLWTIQSHTSLGIDKDRVILGGSSSGANVTAALAHRARDRASTKSTPALKLKGHIMRIPSVCHIGCYPPELNLPSLDELRDAPILSRKSLELFWGNYNPPDPRNPDASPLLHKSFEALPPAYIQVAGMDPLRDEGLAYAEKLRAAGVAVRLDVYPGVPHGFGYYPEMSAARKNVEDLLAGIEYLLQDTYVTMNGTNGHA